MRWVLISWCCAVLAAAEPPPVPDPYGLGERLALIDLLQDVYRIRPAPDASVEALRSAYAQAWRRAQVAAAAPAGTIPDAPDEAAQAAARSRRLRERIADRHHVDADAGLSEAELGALLRRLDADRAERDAVAIAALAAGDRGRETAPPVKAPAPASSPLPASPAPAQAPEEHDHPPAAAIRARDIPFSARGVTACVLVEDAGVSALLVVFGSDHNGAFRGLPEGMIAALHGAPGIHRAVLLLGHGTGTTIAGESIEAHLKANRVFYETLGNTVPAQRIDCLAFASCSASNPNQMLAMRDGLGYFPTWRVATAARSYANRPTVLAALRAAAMRPATPAWRGLFRLPVSEGDVGCFGEVGQDGERGNTEYYRVIPAANGGWHVEEQR